jgi:ribonuclease HI
MQLEVFTDGSFRKETHLGGYGYLICDLLTQTILKSSVGVIPESEASVNPAQMEIIAVIFAYIGLYGFQKQKKVMITGNIFSDSEFLVNAINETMEKWKSNKWKNTKGKKIVNSVWIQRLDQVRSSLECQDIIFQLKYIPSKQGINQTIDQMIRAKMDLWEKPIWDQKKTYLNKLSN